MGTYADTMDHYDDGEHTEVHERYHQPAWRYWTWRVLEYLEGKSHRGLMPLDRALERRHERRCDGKCSYGLVGRRKRDDSWDERMQHYCGYQPLCLRFTLWVYRFHERERRVLDDD